MIRRETPESFLSTAPVSPEFRAFALQEHSTLYELADDHENLVVLSNGTDAAAVFRRGRGKVRVWQTFLQRLPSCPASEAADALRDMTAWMFEHYNADALCAFGPLKNEKARAFTQAAGGRLIGETCDRDHYEFVRSVQ